MADLGSSSWSETDSSNIQNPPNGWPEAMQPSSVNNSARAGMGATKRFWNRINAVKTTAGSSTSYTLTYDEAASQYYDGEIHSFVVDEANGASPTLNINGIGSRPLQFYCGAAWAALPANILGANQVVQVRYDLSALAFRCLNLPTILQQSASAASVIDFTGIPSNVNNLEIDFEVRAATNAVNILLRTYGADGALDTGASDYYYIDIAADSSGASSVATSTTSSILLAGSVSNASVACGGRITAQNIQANTSTKFVFQTSFLNSGGSLGIYGTGTGVRNEADRITGIRLFPSSGTFTGRASVRLS